MHMSYVCVINIYFFDKQKSTEAAITDTQQSPLFAYYLKNTQLYGLIGVRLVQFIISRL